MRYLGLTLFLPFFIIASCAHGGSGYWWECHHCGGGHTELDPPICCEDGGADATKEDSMESAPTAGPGQPWAPSANDPGYIGPGPWHHPVLAPQAPTSLKGY